MRSMGEVETAKEVSMSRIWNTVKGVAPEHVNQIVEDSVRALELLPGMEHWTPSEIQWGKVIEIASWGFPLTCFPDPFRTFDKLCTELGNSIALSGKPARKSLSELNAAALVTTMGTTSVERIPESKTRTPDWILFWNEAY